MASNVRIPLVDFWRYEVGTHTRAPLLAALLAYFVVDPYVVPVMLSSWRSCLDRWEEWSEPIVSRVAWVTLRDGSDAALFIVASVAVHVAMFFGVGGFYLLCDHRGWLQQYKLPRQPRMKNPAGIVAKNCRECCANFVVQLFAMLLVLRWCRFPPCTDPIPSLTHAFGHYAASRLVTETLIYWSHRWAHEFPALYKDHKVHHQYLDSKSWGAEYTGPSDSLSVQVASAAYLLLMAPQMHFSMWLVANAWLLYETYEQHSGYSFANTVLCRRFGLTFGDRAAFHDYHHTHNIGNYGGGYMWDYLAGTMGRYLEHHYALQQADGGDGVCGPASKRFPLPFRLHCLPKSNS